MRHRGTFMKRSFGIAIIAAILAVPAFAASNSQTVTLPGGYTVGATKLPAGNYKVSWTGTAPNVQVTLEQKNSPNPVTATVPATLAEQKHDHTQLLTNNQAGVVKLQSIQLKDVTLTLAGSPAPGQ